MDSKKKNLSTRRERFFQWYERHQEKLENFRSWAVLVCLAITLISQIILLFR